MGCSSSCSRGSSTETGDAKHEEAADNSDQSDTNKKTQKKCIGPWLPTFFKYLLLCSAEERKSYKFEITRELPTEDVLYASIDHNNLKPERQPREVADSDCDYAVVRIPKRLTDTAKQKSSEDCSDDYVLMG